MKKLSILLILIMALSVAITACDSAFDSAEDKLDATADAADAHGDAPSDVCAALGPLDASVDVLDDMDPGEHSVEDYKAALDETVRYCKERKQFGQPIIEFQMVQQMLAEMVVDLQATKMLTRDVLRKYAAGENANLEASIAKIYGADAAMRVTMNAVQLLGGYGYTREFPVERWFRDAKLFAIGGGTSQIQKLILARGLM